MPTVGKQSVLPDFAVTTTNSKNNSERISSAKSAEASAVQEKETSNTDRSESPQKQIKNTDIVELNKKMSIASDSNELSFSIDEETNASVVKVIDKETNEVIRQIPSEEMLAISKSIDELIERQNNDYDDSSSGKTSGTKSGILFSQKA